MQTYDPRLFSMNVQNHLMVGYAPGTFIKASRNEDAFTLKMGADGSSVRVKNANKSGRFEITLMSSSPSNDFLSALAIEDEKAGTAVGPSTVKDGTGAAFAFGLNTWVVKQPDLERGKESGDVTWIIETDLLQLVQGGTFDVP